MVSFEGIGAMVISADDNGAVQGYPCKFSGNKTVTKADDGNAFHGLCLWQRDGIAGIQVDGFATLSYSGTAPAIGEGILAADGAGGVKVGSAGKSRLVVDVDTTNKKVTFRI